MRFEESNMTIEFATEQCCKYDDVVKKIRYFKAVDFIAEYEDSYWFVEIKNFKNPKTGQNTAPQTTTALEELIKTLRNKYIDSFVRRVVEDKNNKDTYYLCVLEGFDAAEYAQLNRKLAECLPDEQHQESGWTKHLLKASFVCNKTLCNQLFAKRLIIT